MSVEFRNHDIAGQFNSDNTDTVKGVTLALRAAGNHRAVNGVVVTGAALDEGKALMKRGTVDLSRLAARVEALRTGQRWVGPLHDEIPPGARRHG